MRGKIFLPIMIICGVFLSAIFILWNFFYIPLQGEILQMQLETKKILAVEDELKTLQSRHGDFAEFVALNGERLNALKKFLPSAPEQEKFSAEIYKLAEKNKIAVTSLQVGEITSVEKKNLSRQSIKIKLEGKYISILNFIRGLADGERFAKLENISLETAENNLILGEAEFFIFNRDE